MALEAADPKAGEEATRVLKLRAEDRHQLRQGFKNILLEFEV